MVAWTFSKMVKTVNKPLKGKLIENPVTIGEKLKNRRLELRLLQKDVASILGVCIDSVTYWENNRSCPQVCHYPQIIQFLGYMPFEVDTSTLGGHIKLYRFQKGLTQEELALKLDLNESTIFHYENNKHKPYPRIRKKLEELFEGRY